jgi:hypothetical protein
MNFHERHPFVEIDRTGGVEAGRSGGGSRIGTPRKVRR